MSGARMVRLGYEPTLGVGGRNTKGLPWGYSPFDKAFTYDTNFGGRAAIFCDDTQKGFDHVEFRVPAMPSLSVLIQGYNSSASTSEVLMSCIGTTYGWRIGIDGSNRYYLTVNTGTGTTKTVTASLAVNGQHKYSFFSFDGYTLSVMHAHDPASLFRNRTTGTTTVRGPIYYGAADPWPTFQFGLTNHPYQYFNCVLVWDRCIGQNAEWEFLKQGHRMSMLPFDKIGPAVSIPFAAAAPTFSSYFAPNATLIGGGVAA
jgi:hypothetical protein